MIRAKFRCMSSKDTWNHHRSYELLPVKASEGAPENSAFWDATPSGKAELTFKAHVLDDPQFLVGHYYFIDFSPLEAGAVSEWELSSVTDHGESQQTAVFRRSPSVRDWDDRGPRHGFVEMDVLNPAAFNRFGKAGKPWRVAFTHAGQADGPELKG